MTENTRLPRTTPEELGISSLAVTSFLEAVHQSNLELHSFMLVRHGKVAAEGWWAPYRAELPHALFSITKSFVSTAVGLAVAEGKLKTEDKVLSFFPDKKPVHPSDYWTGMTVHDLLAMATGFASDSTALLNASEDGDLVAAFLSAETQERPGTRFAYDSGASHMLSAIVQKVTGEKVHDYLKSRLLEPLGITGETWEEDPRGITMGGWGLSLKTEDIAKFGLLYLQRGEWAGKRILPAEWVTAAGSKQVSNGTEPNNDWHAGYGYQFWLNQHGTSFRAAGMYAQKCLIMPEQDAVIVMTSAERDERAILDAVWTHLLPAMHEISLAADEDQHKLLELRLSQLDLRPPGLDPHSPREQALNGRRFLLSDNPFGWEAITLRFEAGKVAAELAAGDGAATVEFGTENWQDGSLQGYRLAGIAGWRLDDLLTARLVYTETPFVRTLEARFEEEGLELRVLHNVPYKPFGFTEEPVTLTGTLEAQAGTRHGG